MVTRTPHGRSASQARSVLLEPNVNQYAEGSVLIKMGNTHVLCLASIEEKVPGWLEGKGQGWITAEYSMLPRSTHTRMKREREKVSGRTQEIQRLIGRALRSIVDLKAVGERTLTIDCDVIQADGGTRTASITGGCVALIIALEKLHKKKLISKRAWTTTVSAISVGMKQGAPLLDLDYEEDSSCDVDMNFVITGKSEFVEVQGTAEKQVFSKAQLDQMVEVGTEGCEFLKKIQLQTLSGLGIEV